MTEHDEQKAVIYLHNGQILFIKGGKVKEDISIGVNKCHETGKIIETGDVCLKTKGGKYFHVSSKTAQCFFENEWRKNEKNNSNRL